MIIIPINYHYYLVQLVKESRAVLCIIIPIATDTEREHQKYNYCTPEPAAAKRESCLLVPE